MKIEVQDIGPNEARFLLSKNGKNRPLSKRLVDKYADAMRRGQWEFNGDTITIADTGVLIDGQHRLAAIQQSGITCRYPVVTGVKESVFDTKDRGKGRTIGDILATRGEQHYNTLGAVARLIYMWKEYSNPFYGAPDRQPTARDLERVIDQHPDIRNAISELMGNSWAKRYMTARIGSFCWFVFCRDDDSCTRIFFDQCQSGVVHGPYSPVRLLRDRLMEDKNSKNRIGDRYKAALIFKAYRYFKIGKDTRFLRVREVGDAQEKDLFKV